MQQALQAGKHRLAEAYAEQSAKKREIKETEKNLVLQNSQLEEQKRKLQEMVARLRADEEAVKKEMNSLRQDRLAIDEGQKKWLKEAAELRLEKDLAEKKGKQRAGEIERLSKLKEALDKKEPMQVKELERLNKLVDERESKQDERSKEIKQLREEIDNSTKSLGGERGRLQELQRKKAELVGELQITSEETDMTEGVIERLELKLQNLAAKSDDFRVQKEALDHAIADAAREGDMLQKQLRESESLRDAQVKTLEDMTRTLAHAQADLTQRTEELRKTNESKAEAEMHLRAEYERQKERAVDLAARARDLQSSMDEVVLQGDVRAEQVADLESKLKEMEDAADDGEIRVKELTERLKKAQERWENVEQIQATGLEREMQDKLKVLQEEHAKFQELKEQVAAKAREDAEIKDEIAVTTRAQVDAETSRVKISMKKVRHWLLTFPQLPGRRWTQRSSWSARGRICTRCAQSWRRCSKSSWRRRRSSSVCVRGRTTLINSPRRRRRSWSSCTRATARRSFRSGSGKPSCWSCGNGSTQKTSRRRSRSRSWIGSRRRRAGGATR